MRNKSRQPADIFSLKPSPVKDSQPSVPQNPSISACLIVKNEAHCLTRCLESIRHLVDEIIVVDTGSTDATLTIARQYTDKIFHHRWNDHFAEARNVGLAQATGDWVLIIDADEVMPAETARLLTTLLARAEFQHRAVVLNWLVISTTGNRCFKRGLFPNHRGIQFTGRVHEGLTLANGILPSFNCFELLLQDQGLPSLEKERFYQRLMAQALRESTRPAHLYHLQKHLGLSQMALGQWPQAWQTLKACYSGMQRQGVSPEEGFYQAVLRGLVKIGHILKKSETQNFRAELEQIGLAFHQPGFDFQPAGRKRTLLAQSLMAVGIGVLAACQPSPTVTQSGLPSVKPSAASSVSQRDLSGIKDPLFQRWLAQKEGRYMPPLALEKGDAFHIEGQSGYATSFQGCLGGSGRDAGYFIQQYANGCIDSEEDLGDWSWVSDCYNAPEHGTPYYKAIEQCEVAPSGCARITYTMQPLYCLAYDGSYINLPGGPGGSSPSSSPGQKDMYLTLDKEWFSPNGDGSKDSVGIDVTSPYPWLMRIKKGGTVLKEYTGQSSAKVYWEGEGANGVEGKYNIVLIPPRKQNVEKDNQQVGIDLTPPTVDFKTTRRLNGQVEMKVTIVDPGPPRSGLDKDTIQITTSSANLTIDSGLDSPVKDGDNKLVYNLILNQNLFATHTNNFQITSLAYSTLALNGPVGGTYNGDVVRVEVQDVAGNSAAQESESIASPGSPECANSNDETSNLQQILLNEIKSALEKEIIEEIDSRTLNESFSIQQISGVDVGQLTQLLDKIRGASSLEEIKSVVLNNKSILGKLGKLAGIIGEIIQITDICMDIGDQLLLLDAIKKAERVANGDNCHLSNGLRHTLLDNISALAESVEDATSSYASNPEIMKLALSNLKSFLDATDFDNICENGCKNKNDGMYLNSEQFQALPAKGKINPKKIRFSQDSIKQGFKNPAHGTVDDLINNLKNTPEKIDQKRLEIRLVEKYGKVFTLDNRRLYAFQQAGLDIYYSKLGGIPSKEKSKFTSDNCGELIIIRPGIE